MYTGKMHIRKEYTFLVDTKEEAAALLSKLVCDNNSLPTSDESITYNIEYTEDVPEQLKFKFDEDKEEWEKEDPKQLKLFEEDIDLSHIPESPALDDCTKSMIASLAHDGRTATN